MAEQDPAVEPINEAEGLSAIAKIRERMANAKPAETTSAQPQTEVVPGLCINCQQAELEDGVCPNCKFDDSRRLYTGGV